MQKRIRIPNSEITNTIRSLELYSRVGVGQFREFFSELENNGKYAHNVEHLSNLCETFKIEIFDNFRFGLTINSYISIGSAKKEYRIAYLIMCCLKNITYNLDPTTHQQNIWKHSPLTIDTGIDLPRRRRQPVLDIMPAIYLKPFRQENKERFDLELYITEEQYIIYQKAISLKKEMIDQKAISCYIKNLHQNYGKSDSEMIYDRDNLLQLNAYFRQLSI